MSADKCSHGKTWDETCTACEKVGLLEMLEHWEPKIERAKARLRELETLDKPDDLR